MNTHIYPVRVNDARTFRATHPEVTQVNTLEDQRAEFLAAYPDRQLQPESEAVAYFIPWKNSLVWQLPQDDFELLLSARGRHLFSNSQINKLAHASVGIAGLSVGSRVVEPLAHGPALSEIRLADMDVVSATGLGRQPFSTADLGLSKVVSAARLITEIRPWAKVTANTEGLTRENLDQFVEGLDIVVDAMDNPSMKLALRESAAKFGVDVIMGTDVECGIIDFEPYGSEPDYPAFHGLVSSETLDALRRHPQAGPHNIKAIAEIVGLQNLTLEGLQMAIALVTGQLKSMSQLATTSVIVGGAVARMIHLRLAGFPVKIGRTILGVEQNLLENDPIRDELKADLLKKFVGMMGATPAEVL